MRNYLPSFSFLSYILLNAAVLGASTSSSDRLFHFLTTLLEKKYRLTLKVGHHKNPINPKNKQNFNKFLEEPSLFQTPLTDYTLRWFQKGQIILEPIKSCQLNPGTSSPERSLVN